jgi:cell division protease FtsH
MLLFSSLIRMIFTRQMKKFGNSNGNLFKNPGKTTAKIYNLEETTGVTFDDVAGQNEAKENLNEIIDFLKNPEKYEKIGAKQPAGALLVGPPGTGKTLLAKAVAGEAGVPFYSLSGSEFIEMFVGVGASRVRDLFEQAKKHSPSIIFIDEIDAIGKSRDSQMGGNDEREQTLNQLLAEMDGFDSSDAVVVLAATNRPESLDKALLRPGRFDRQIIVDKPDMRGRVEILKVHIKNVKVEDDIDLQNIALMTSGASGADLANMVNEAALRAVRFGREKVTQEDLQEAVEKVIAGDEMKDRILSPKEKKLVSYHEVGHAFASALQKNSMPVQKITIVPRTIGALGYTLQVPEEERFLMTKEEILDQISVLLSGRAAEKVMMDTESTGAANDIERATAMARSMVTQYGMSENFGVMGLEKTQDKYLDGRNVLTSSEATGEAIDKEVHKIIETCYQNAINLLSENKDALEEISAFLYEKETITGEQFMEILDKYKD